MNPDQKLKRLVFSLYPILVFLYIPFKDKILSFQRPRTYKIISYFLSMMFLNFSNLDLRFHFPFNKSFTIKMLLTLVNAVK